MILTTLCLRSRALQVLCYLLIAIPICVFLLIVRPPLTVPDEVSHVARAADIANGHLLGPPGRNGRLLEGPANQGLLTIFVRLSERRYEPIDRSTVRLFLEMPWTVSELPFRNNALLYAPVAYIPQTVGLLAAWQLRLKVWDSVRLGGALNAAVALLMAATAITITPIGAPFLFSVLCLPMTLFMAASFSPDATIMAGAALFVAIALRSLDRGTLDSKAAIGLAVTAIFCTATRLNMTPCVLAVFAILSARLSSRRSVVSAGLISLGFAFAWAWVTDVGTASYGGVDEASNQSAAFSYLLNRPLAVLSVASSTLATFGKLYVVGMLGTLGWADANIARWAAWPLLLALCFCLLGAAQIRSTRVYTVERLLVLLGVLSSVGATFLALYLTYNPVGSEGPILGVQGRYFVPILPFLLFCVPPFAVMRPLFGFAPAIAIGSALLSGAAVFHTVVMRYYLIP
jgi:hypothetical protein